MIYGSSACRLSYFILYNRRHRQDILGINTPPNDCAATVVGLGLVARAATVVGLRLVVLLIILKVSMDHNIYDISHDIGSIYGISKVKFSPYHTMDRWVSCSYQSMAAIDR